MVPLDSLCNVFDDSNKAHVIISYGVAIAIKRASVACRHAIRIIFLPLDCCLNLLVPKGKENIFSAILSGL